MVPTGGLRSRSLALLLAIGLATVPAFQGSALGEDEAQVQAVAAEPRLGPAEDATLASGPIYEHYDCVGPEAPGLSGEHDPDPHTETATGFAFGGGAVTFAIQTLSLFTEGTCPLTLADGPVLAHDFTGTYHLVAHCGEGAYNEGATWYDWKLDIVAGVALGESAAGTPCYGPAGETFEADFTIEIGETEALLGVPLDPTGGVELTITQG